MKYKVGEELVDALLLFVDLIDSSKFSSVLGYFDYAERLLAFQEHFEELGEIYFPVPSEKVTNFQDIHARGDEGILFVVQTKDKAKPEEMIHKAIEFVFHLKGRLKYINYDNQGKNKAPKDIGIAAGIHYDKVAYLIPNSPLKGRSIIQGIEGYSINYAKRVETSSRNGKYSNIFLSKKAVQYLKSYPIILHKIYCQMKGIDDNEEVYEIRSGYFDSLLLDPANSFDENLIKELVSYAKSDSNNEQWINSLAISVFDILLKGSPIINRKKEYYQMQLDLAWKNYNEEDPILLLKRARDFYQQSNFTQSIKYLHKILNQCPSFIYAQKEMVKACIKIIETTKLRDELVYARDTALEFVEHYSEFLSEDEKKDFEGIIIQTRELSKIKD